MTGYTTSKFHDLDRDGFTILPGPLRPADLRPLAEAYDRAVRLAAPGDMRYGSTTTRVDDLVNAGPEFDCIYVHQLLLDACRRFFARPFRLSAMLARTLRPMTPAQRLHQDFPPDHSGWTMLGFILLIDDFCPENGATCLIPGSHRSAQPPSADAVPACGPAGAMLIYNGAVWHGHGANVTASPRRSIQGAFLRADFTPGYDLAARMRPETLARLGPVSKSLIFPDSR